MRVLSERQYYKQIVSQNLHHRSLHYHRFACVEQAIGTRLLESLDLMKIHPTLILDLGSGTGDDAERLALRYPEAQIVQLDLSHTMTNVAKHKHPHAIGPAKKPQGLDNRLYQTPNPYYLCADAEAIPLQSNSVDLVVSNALLPWLPDCEVIFEEVRRVLKPGGLFLFSSFGPDTLKECNQVLSQMNIRNVHENALLVDMHDLGDQLVQASFESPVMDSSLLTLEYGSPFALIRDLHRTGWSYAIPSMERSILKTFLGDFKKHYECYQDGQGHYLATFEVIVGHAWCGAKKEDKTTLKTLALKVLSTL